MVHETNDHVYFSMEYCDGGTLWEKLRSKKFGIQESLSIAQSLIQGLQHIHNTTIEGRRALHRDIKSDNILLGMNGEVKVTDFGFCAQVTPDRDKRTTMVGTPYWMAPEVTTGTYIPYDHKVCRITSGRWFTVQADIWSLGVTCIEMADLVPPNTHLAPMRAVLEIAKNPPPTMSKPELWYAAYDAFVMRTFHIPSGRVTLRTS